MPAYTPQAIAHRESMYNQMAEIAHSSGETYYHLHITEYTTTELSIALAYWKAVAEGNVTQDA